MFELGKLYKYTGEMDKDIHPVDPTLDDRYIQNYEALLHGSFFVLLKTEKSKYSTQNACKILTTRGEIGWVYLNNNDFVQALRFSK